MGLKKRESLFVWPVGKCQSCGKPSVTKRSSYCQEHMEQLMIKKIREGE